MNVQILRVVKCEKTRRGSLLVSVSRAQILGQNSDWVLIKIYGAVRRFLGEIRQGARLILAFKKLKPGKVVFLQAGAKSYEVADHLKASGIDNENITYLFGDEIKSTRQLWDFLKAIIKSLSVGVFLRIRQKHYSNPFADVIFLFLLFRGELKSLDSRHWIIIGDLSPESIALTVASRVAGHKVVSWQFDFLDFLPYPIEPDIAIVMNEQGIDLARKHTTLSEDFIFWQQRAEMKNIRPVDLDRPTGVLLMAFSGERELKRLSQLQLLIGTRFEVRLHPRSNIDRNRVPKNLFLAQGQEALDEFVSRMGLVICGNTTAQFKAILAGCPVIQLPKLDIFPFDIFGYVSRGLIYGTDIESGVSADDIDSFYMSELNVSRIERLLGPASEKRAPSFWEYKF